MKKVLKIISVTIFSLIWTSILLLIITIIIWAFWSCLFEFLEEKNYDAEIKQSYKLGHFEHVLKLPKEYTIFKIDFSNYKNTLKLKNGNILILGPNYHECLVFDKKPCNAPNIQYSPSYIYDVKAKQLKEITLPKDIMYFPEGIMLDNNRLLLTGVYIPDKPKKFNSYKRYDMIRHPYYYDFMAIVNLNTMKTEKIIKKKTSDFYSGDVCEEDAASYSRLGNGKIVSVDSYYKMIEIFDLKNGTSELIKDVNIQQSEYNTIIPYDKDKILIFCHSVDDIGKQSSKDDIIRAFEYDTTTKVSKPVEKVLKKPLLKARYLGKNKIYIGFQDQFQIYDLIEKRISTYKVPSKYLSINQAYPEMISDDNIAFFGIQDDMDGFLEVLGWMDFKEENVVYSPVAFNLKKKTYLRFPEQKYGFNPTIRKLNDGTIFILHSIKYGIMQIELFKPSKN